jgi:putative membrane protein
MTLIPSPLPGVGAVSPAHGQVTDSVWTAWNADPLILIPAVLVGFWYLRGVRRMRSRRHRGSQTALFFLGLGALVLALQSPIDPLGEHHFSIHVVQHELFVLFGAPLLLLGAPTTPLLLGLPRSIRRDVVRPIAGSAGGHRLYRVLTFPPVSIGVLVAMLWGWHFTPGAFDAALSNDFVHDLMHLSFVSAAFLFWWPVIDPLPLHSRLGYGARIAYLMPMILARIVTGAAITFADEPIYQTYLEVEPVMPIEPIGDQQLGALLMWVPGTMMHLVVIAIIFSVWAEKSRPTDPPKTPAMGPTVTTTEPRHHES